jgi:hypothetical protein
LVDGRVAKPGFAEQADRYFRALAPFFRMPIYYVPPTFDMSALQNTNSRWLALKPVHTPNCRA